MPTREELTHSRSRLRSVWRVIKACRDIMRKDKGLNGDVDRLPMLTWIMFLKFLDDMERVRERRSRAGGQAVPPRSSRLPIAGGIGTPPTPTVNRDGLHNANDRRCADCLHQPGRGSAARRRARRRAICASSRARRSGDGVERRDVVASVFRGTVNRMQSGYILRDVLDKVNEIHFSSSEEIHTLGHLYESMLKEMRDAAGDSGEFYTPRPLVRMIVTAVDPRPGEMVLDPAAGTGGFLVESYEHMRRTRKTVEDLERLQRGTFFGIEAKPLPYLLCADEPAAARRRGAAHRSAQCARASA